MKKTIDSTSLERYGFDVAQLECAIKNAQKFKQYSPGNFEQSSEIYEKGIKALNQVQGAISVAKAVIHTPTIQAKNVVK